jgi:hypothetical protein
MEASYVTDKRTIAQKYGSKDAVRITFTFRKRKNKGLSWERNMRMLSQLSTQEKQ